MSESERQPLLESVLESTAGWRPVEQGDYRVYRRRWYILFVVALLNISSGMIWITFSPIADLTQACYHITSMQVNWLSLVFMVCTIVLGILASFLLDHCGLRSGIILSSWLNVIGSALRVVSALPEHTIPQHYKYPILLAGQTIAGCAQPFMLFAPTKVAALWFPNSQRATANMVASVSNPIGILLANVLSPLLVTKPDQIPFLLQLYAIPAGLAVLMATFGVCSSVPPIPPSASAAEASESFCDGLKQIMRNKSYWVLGISFGAGLALFTTLSTLLEQILAPQGYSDQFAGLCGALLFGVGVVGAALASVYVDRTKKFEEVSKISYGMAALSSVVFMVLAHFHHMEVPLAVVISAVGFFGFALYPVCLELCVECTFPVAEATSAGFLIVSGQIQAIVYVLVMQALAKPVHSESLKPEYDYGVARLVYCGICAVVAVFYIATFKCDYRRMQAEQQIVAQQILNFRSSRQSGQEPIAT